MESRKILAEICSETKVEPNHHSKTVLTQIHTSTDTNLFKDKESKRNSMVMISRYHDIKAHWFLVEMIHSDSDSPRAIPTALPITYQMPDSKLAGAANDLLVSLFPSPGNLGIPFLPPHCE